MRTAMPSYAMRVRPSDSVATICKRFRALPKTVSDVSVNTNDLLAGRTSIEAVQIQMVLFETCLTRTLNGSADLILTESKSEVIWRPDYLHVMLAEASLIGGANVRITDHLNLLYRRTKIKLEGSCFGLTDLAIKAYSAGELHHFVDRVHALCSISPYKLMFFLQDLKALILRYETAKSGLMLLSIGKHELQIMQLRLQQLRSFHTDILGFFDAVILTQSPDYFSKALLVTGASNIDQYKYPAAAIVSPVEVSDANKNAQFATEVDMYRQKDFCQFLRCISAALVRDCNDDFSINLRVYRHRIALHYNATQEKWLLQDPNRLPGVVYLNTPTGRADLAICLYRNIGAGAKGAVVCCHMSLYGRAGTQESLRSRMSLFQRLFEKVERPADYLKRMRTGCDIFGETLLNLGCCMGDVDVCENALIAGADVNVEVRKGKATPLLLACSFGHEGVVEVLLKYGATISKAVDRLTPLHVARVSGYPRIARLLLNALQQQKTKSGTATMKDLPASTELSPLLQACQLNDAKMVGQLLFAGADVEVSRPDGFRPLHIACQNGNAIIVEMLLKAGADTHVKVKAKTPASIARHHHSIAKLLKKYHGNKPFRRVSGSSLFQVTGINPCVKSVNNAVLGMPVSPSSLSY